MCGYVNQRCSGARIYADGRVVEMTFVWCSGLEESHPEEDLSPPFCKSATNIRMSLTAENKTSLFLSSQNK